VLWGQPVLHSIIMFRRSVLENIGGYSEDPQHLYSPDQEIVSRALRSYQGANLREPLFKWRRHSQTLSSVNERAQGAQGFTIVQDNIRAMVGEDRLTPDVWLALKAFMLNSPFEEVQLSAAQLVSAVSLLTSLERSFYQFHRFSSDEIRSHRRRLYRSWARHSFALSYRNNGKRGFLSRAKALSLAVRLARQAMLSPF
ncbi:MAG: hypothetical protein LC775_08005, partial [Acidobacteria bacterium]|nr:hypothetical protein [Acidobacteriota bacterium]